MVLPWKDLGIIPRQPNRATLRSNPVPAVREYGGGQRQWSPPLFKTGYLSADKPQGVRGTESLWGQATNLSSKKIENCAYASPQSFTGIVHFLDISFVLI